MLKRRLGWEERQELEAGLDFSDATSASSSSESETESEVSNVEGTTEEVNTETVQASEKMKKTKVMILSGRAINARQRHFMDDLCALLPHLKKESKFDTKDGLFELNELAEMNGCTHCLFFEPKKPQELFIWASRCPSGPSVRFHVQNSTFLHDDKITNWVVSTLEELHQKGNCMKNTRAILSFDPEFAKTEEGNIMQELLTSIFTVPENHRKTKPYYDHIFQFSMLDGRIWFRNYQINHVDEDEQKLKEKTQLSTEAPELVMDGLSLAEIGPRFVLHPVRAFEGSFGGPTLYKNPNYVPPSEIRQGIMHQVASKYNRRQDQSEVAAIRRKDANLSGDELEEIFE